MHPAQHIEFNRLAQEMAAWRAVPADDRSPAPGWWWGPAMALRHAKQPLSPEDCRRFGLPLGASFADAGNKVMAFLAAQRSLTRPSEFPKHRSKHRPIKIASLYAMAAE
ncbi:hypothetical protein [Rhodopseudomonas palustris]|jgi:hypothetical protein|uniref:Uncharacterized protein n=1 Tax=Rhodopseudomonas palustris (strain ATCC BAA-98 / CGA009) TaxID=258594 RepID=Q6N218_RHOPA|nr:hypothetical protein [Rhodopseudomonas palustris]OPF92377.1 hypothetical protein B1S06_14440 [Rhodopseudomonas palustris]PPQ41848.1 hypothetical protein CKO39_19795 [Rhodopseudomonas palustris]RJF64011.1 hypothetical protein D4Q71_13025 [Rhodopseudomonas palustris]WAB77121.1 hypothetical protein OR798_21935 [Rhodopseudomonas palustris]WBU29326.1 hypothetical protein OOZ54_22090 [Rhodopseudomonas palustris]